MAITKSKLVSTGDLKLVFILEDEAIDVEKSDIGKYFETLDEKHLAFKEGVEPSKFYMRGPTSIELRRCSADIEAKQHTGSFMGNPIEELGFNLLKVCLTKAEDVFQKGDSFFWKNGCPESFLAQFSANIQSSLSYLAYFIANGALTKGNELENEKK